MSVFHDEVEIEDFEYDPETETYYYPCPCGDQFEITRVRRVRKGLTQLSEPSFPSVCGKGHSLRCGYWFGRKCIQDTFCTCIHILVLVHISILMQHSQL